MIISVLVFYQGNNNTNVAFDKLGQVYVPNFKRDRESEQVDAPLINLDSDCEYAYLWLKKNLTLKLSSKYLFSSRKAA